MGHSYDEQFFSCTYVKEVMTDQAPKGPVVYSLRNGNAHYIGATVDLDRRIVEAVLNSVTNTLSCPEARHQSTRTKEAT